VERRADKQPVLAQRGGQVRQPPLHRPVQVTLRRPILPSRDHLPRAHRRQRRPGRLKPRRVGILGPFRSLQVHEMLQRHLPERQQPQLHPRRVTPCLVRQVGPAHIRGRPHGREQVLHHRPMQHLLTGDGQDHLAPALYRLQLILPKTGTRRALEAERSVEILAQQAVLKLSTLAEQVGQLLAVPHHNARLPHKRTISPAMAGLNGADAEGVQIGGHGGTAGVSAP
jgi:hypothetical protein